MNDYLSFRHVHVTDDPFDDAPCNQQPNLILEKATEAQDVSSLKASFISAIMGRGMHVVVLLCLQLFIIIYMIFTLRMFFFKFFLGEYMSRYVYICISP